MPTSMIWNPLDPASIRDPYPLYADLREHEPVYWHEGMKSYVLTRYDDCRRVLRDHDVFARDRRRVGVKIPDDKLNIQTQDPPDQAELRALTGKALAAQPLEQICADARRVLADHFLSVAKDGPLELMHDAAGPAAMFAINQLFGVDDFTAKMYAPIFQGLTQSMDSGLDPTRLPSGRAAGDALRFRMQTWIDAGLGNGVVAALRGNDAVADMPDSYVRNTLVAIYNAGFSTIYAVTGSVIQAVLSGNLDQVLALDVTDRSALRVAADELLRFTSPAQATARVAVKSTEVQGVPISYGDVLVTMMGAANRDPRQFVDPDTIRLDRQPNAHLAYAWGPHICLGARLGTAWVMEVITFLIEFGPRLRLRPGAEWMNAATLRNLVTLPIEYLPAA